MQARGKLEQRGPRRHRARGWWLLVLAFVAVGTLYLAGVLAPATGTFHDDGIYLGTARALAEGDGYRIVSLPSEEPQTKYPPLFPASLAAVWTLLPEFPANLPMLRLVTVFWTLLWCRFAYLVLRKEADATTASVLILLTLCSPWVYFLATSLMSEALFACLTWGALWQFSGYEERPDESSGRRRLWLAALFGGAAALTRMLGACFIAASLLWLLFHRRVRDALAFGGVSAVLLMPWLGWTMLSGSGQSAGYYSVSNYISWNPISDFSWSESAAVLGHNLFLLLLTPGYLFGLFEPETIPLLFLVGVLTCLGMAARLRSGLRMLDFFLLVYLAAIAFWPWPPIRFVAPLYPLVLLLAWRGADTIFSSVATVQGRVEGQGDRSNGPRTSAAVMRRATAGVALILAAATVGTTARSVSESGMITPAPGCQDSWAEFESLFAWIESETPGDAVLAANLDPVLFLYTGRKALRPFEADPVQLYYSRSPDREPLGPPSELARRLRSGNVDYLITTPGTCFEETKHLERQLEALLSNGNGLLREVERFSSATRVYAVQPQ